MYVRSHWDVLVVDDEPDVLTITRLALKNLSVLGIPLKVHDCSSKKQAIELIESSALRSGINRSRLALAMIDVVMDTDEAGLELCAYLREKQKNDTLQIVIRTGQPGLAPERDITDRYDINSYVSKVDATEDRLYSIVKNGIRQYFGAVSRRFFFGWSSRLVAAAASREALLGVIRSHMLAPCTDPQGKPIEGQQGHIALFIGDRIVGIGDAANVDVAKGMRQALEGVERRAVTETGDTFGRQGANVILSLAAESGLPAVESVARTNYDPVPDFMIEGWIHIMRTLRYLWTRAE